MDARRRFVAMDEERATVEVARNSDVVIGIAVALIGLVSRFYVSPVTRQKVTA